MDERMRRLTRLAPIFAVSGVFAAWVANGCGWDYEVATTVSDTDGELGADTFEPTDGGDETPTDSSASYTLPDGRVCTGNDEDGDGVPDECDNCPNVKNADQAGGAVGDACMTTEPFISSPSRLLFDPFRSISSWSPFGSGSGVFALGDDSNSVVGGDATAVELPFLVGATGSGTSAISVTTTIKITDEASEAPSGSAGLIFRVSGDMAKKFYLCAVSYKNGFAVARTPDSGCSGGLCAPVTFTMPVDGGSSAAQVQIPSDIPHALGDTIGLRASVSVSMGDGGILGQLECRVFDPQKPETLTSTDPKYFIRVSAGGTRWFPSGEIGVYAQRARASFGSVDVLRGP